MRGTIFHQECSRRHIRSSLVALGLPRIGVYPLIWSSLVGAEGLEPPTFAL